MEGLLLDTSGTAEQEGRRVAAGDDAAPTPSDFVNNRWSDDKSYKKLCILSFFMGQHNKK
jgi:hypothetical protein